MAVTEVEADEVLTILIPCVYGSCVHDTLG